MIKATTFKVKKRGPGRPEGNRLKKWELQRLYVEEENSIREIAGLLGCSKDRVYRALEEYGIKRRSHTKESILAKYELEDLKRLVGEKGYRKAAADLGMTGQGLWNYINRKKAKINQSGM